MPPSARPKRPQRPSANRGTPAVVRADDGGDIDPMDAVLGVVWAIAIPLGVYLLLAAAGMPPGGGGGAPSAKVQMERNEELKNVKPPVTYREIDLRLARVDDLIQNRVPEFLRRAKETDDNRLKNEWQELAFRVLGICRNTLEEVQEDIPNSEELRGRPEVDQGIRRRLAHIEQQEEQIIRENPFPDRLRAAQVEAVQDQDAP